MINREEFFAAFAHSFLGSKEFFRGHLIGHLIVGGDVAESIDRGGVPALVTANQAATLSRITFTGVGNNVSEMSGA